MDNRDLNLHRFVINCGFKKEDIISIKNDASFRKYYRIKNKNLIVMDAPPEKGESVEQFKTEIFNPNSRDHIADRLKTLGIGTTDEYLRMGFNRPAWGPKTFVESNVSGIGSIGYLE